jgi:apolipoprotein N-acyltransferase
MMILSKKIFLGPGGAYHAKSNSLRAVENGFTLFRCASQSISGVFEPTIQGMYNQRVGTYNDESYIFQLPIQKRMNTLYGYIGDIFSYMCLTAAIVMLVMKKRQLQI